MRVLRVLLDKIHTFLANYWFFVLLAIRIRNQTNMIIGRYLTSSHRSELNGEFAILHIIAPHCKSFVDVGANVGNWTQYFLKCATPLTKAVLFEPGIGAFRALTQRYGDYDRITLINKALGSKSGKVEFIEKPGCDETSCIASLCEKTDVPLISVDISTLDSELSALQVYEIDYAKIDAEGYDFEVILGAKDLLRKNRIRFVQFEYNHPWFRAGSTLFQALAFLKDCGYRTMLIRRDGLYDFNYELYGEFYRYCNFLSFLPTESHLVLNAIRGRI